MNKILVIEDDEALCFNLMENLEKWDFEVFKISNFDQIVKELLLVKPHIVIMDVNLPYFDGFYWCKRIREISQVPVIFLSARDTTMDAIMAINQGGDDYITKPFSFDLLIAKIQALLRRTYDYQNGMREILEHKGVTLDIANNKVSFGELKVELTRNEHKVLLMLLKNKTRVVSHEKLLKSLWDNEIFTNENTLAVNINRIRGKLESIGVRNFILTKKGEGYIIP